MSTSLTSIGAPAYADINAPLQDLARQHRPLIVVHRGSQGGTIVENTAKAIQAAVAQGADLVEIDVIRSTDGDFFLFHNGYEKMHFDEDRDITEMSSPDIEALQYRWVVSENAGTCGVEKLSTVLDAFPDVILNIDRSWDWWDTLLDYLAERGVENRVLLKCPAKAEHLEILNNHPVNFPFMPIVESKSELELALRYSDINLVAVELLARERDDYLARVELIDELHGHGLLVLLNALNLANLRPLFLGWDDEVSVLKDPGLGWGRLIDHGADMIQTDWPALLRTFRQTVNG